MRTFLFLFTEPPTRDALARSRPPGRMILATDQVTAEDRRVFDECIELPPPVDMEETLRSLSAIRADEIVSQTEDGLLPGALLAARRGMRGPRLGGALLTANKWLSRLALARAGVRVPRFALASTAADVRRFADGAFPVVLKPIACTMGRLVTIVGSDIDVGTLVEELRARLQSARDVLRCAAFARLAGLDMGCDPTKQFLVEEFAAGAAIEVDGLVRRGAIECFPAIEQVIARDRPLCFDGYLGPVHVPAAVASARSAVAALDLVDAGFSVELRDDTIIEVNGRLGEDTAFPELFRRLTGVYPILRWIDPGRSCRPAAGCHAVAYQNRYEPGVVRSVHPADGATAAVCAGTPMHASDHPDFCPHLAWAVARDPVDARRAYAIARARVMQVRFDVGPPARERSERSPMAVANAAPTAGPVSPGLPAPRGARSGLRPRTSRSALTGGWGPASPGLPAARLAAGAGA
jgi:hypothetical protein